jgi:hypothetical protein
MNIFKRKDPCARSHLRDFIFYRNSLLKLGFTVAVFIKLLNFVKKIPN